jgi:carboxyl-terminal processing protease
LEQGTAWEGQECGRKAEECAEEMRKDAQTHGWLGVSLELNSEVQMRITKVWPGSPAERAGIRAGDQILSMNGVKVSAQNVEKLFSLMRGARIGERIALVVPRGPGDMTVHVTLERIPEQLLAENIEKHIQDHHKGGKR